MAYRADYPDFGPALTAEKLAERGWTVGVETLRRWLAAEGLWQRRRRDVHRSRRPRRECFGELVQMSTSIHAWFASLVGGIASVTTVEAKDMPRRLAREEGLFAGTSSGANVVAAIRVGQELRPAAHVVTLMVDSGLKYLSTDVYRRSGRSTAV